MKTEAQAAAAARYDEAKRVVAAYAVQVRRRSARWLAATNAAESRYLAAELSEATTQHAWAQQREREAWKAWHRIKPNE